MTVAQLVKEGNLRVVSGGECLNREFNGRIYCCDLLSLAMGRVPADSAWITVMANRNTIAVAVLCAPACVVIAEDMEITDAVVECAAQHGVALLASKAPVYETARAIEMCFPTAKDAR